MAFSNSQTARLYYGRFALAAYSRSAGANHAVDMHDVTVLTDTAKQFIPGSDTGTFSAAGPMPVDETTFNTLLALNKGGVAPIITYLPFGADGPGWLVSSYQTALETSAAHSGTVDWSIAAQLSGVTDINGVVLENNTTVTTDTDGTANNNGAGTTNGAVFHLHVTAYTGLTSDVIIVEGSTTGAFAGEETTIATFVTATSSFFAFGGTDRQVVTGTVPRYLRVVDDVTGAGSITRLVAVSRR